MSKNQFLKYYVNQAGNGLSSFQGIRFQRGRGVFGTILDSAIFPLLKYLAPKVMQTGLEITDDIIDGQPIVDSIKKRGKNQLRNIAGDIEKRASTYSQTGKGNRRNKLFNRKVKKSRKSRNKKSKKKTNDNSSLFI
jgi:hypothetical protein